MKVAMPSSAEPKQNKSDHRMLGAQLYADGIKFGDVSVSLAD
jgi:hypothetical protein